MAAPDRAPNMHAQSGRPQPTPTHARPALPARPARPQGLERPEHPACPMRAPEAPRQRDTATADHTPNGKHAATPHRHTPTTPQRGSAATRARRNAAACITTTPHTPPRRHVEHPHSAGNLYQLMGRLCAMTQFVERAVARHPLLGALQGARSNGAIDLWVPVRKAPTMGALHGARW